MHNNFFLTTRFNFIVFFLRIIMIVAILAMFIAFVWLVSQRIKRDADQSFGVYITIIVGLALIPWTFWRYLIALRDQRHILSIGLLDISEKSIGRSNRRLLTSSDIAGYKMSDYPMRFWNFKCLVIYLKTGERWELPQFLYWNFRDIGPALEEIGVEFLGTEKYRFKWWPL